MDPKSITQQAEFWFKETDLKTYTTITKNQRISIPLPSPNIIVETNIPNVVTDTVFSFEWKTINQTLIFDGFEALAVNELMRSISILGGPCRYDFMSGLTITFKDNASTKLYRARRVRKLGLLTWVVFENNLDTTSKYIVSKTFGSPIQTLFYAIRSALSI